MKHKKMVIIVCMLILCNVQAVASISDENTGTICVKIPTSNYEIKTTEQGDEISVENFGYLLVQGKPDLPSKIFSIAIPPGAELIDIDFDLGDGIFLPNNYEIPPVPLPVVIGDTKLEIQQQEQRIYDENFNSVYLSDEPYPSSNVEFVRTAGFRKYNLVDVRINPFTYYPLSEELVYYPEVNVIVHYEFPDGYSDDNILVDNIDKMEYLAEKIILNYNQAKTWYPITPMLSEKYDYVIITTDSLELAVSSLANWEESKGRCVNVVTTSWISSNYDGYDLAEEIRNFLRDKYPSSKWGIEDVCLVGNYDDVPMRRCEQNTGYGKPETDFYYAELSLPDNQSWDQDGDHLYGENTDPIDFYSEVNVGRIPWSNTTIVSNICDKSVEYEQNVDPAYKKNILLLGSFFWPDTDNAVLMEKTINHIWMNDWTKTRMYEQGQSLYPSDYDLSYSNLLSIWSSGKFAYVNWAGHGSSTACYEFYPSQPFVDTSMCDSLNDDYPSIIFANACSNSDTDKLNIGQSMMKQGAVGFLGATKVAYGMPGWNNPYSGSSQSLDYFFSECVTSGYYTQGQAHQWALLEMYTNGLWYYPRYETFEWGALWGNPDLAMLTPLLSIHFPEGLPEFIESGVSTSIIVEIKSNTDTYVEGSGKLFFRCGDGKYTELSLIHLDDDLYEAILPPFYGTDNLEFYFSAEGEIAGLTLSPINAPDDKYNALVGEFIPVFTDDFEIDMGWSVENDLDITAGIWERGLPVGNGSRGDPPTDNDGSGQCYLTENKEGDSDVDDGATRLISPTIDCSEGEDVIINYALWYTNDYGNNPNNDFFKVYISNDNGENWHLVETFGTISSTDWKEFSFIVGDFVTPNNKIKICFEASDLNEKSIVEAGIDTFNVFIFNNNHALADLCYEGSLEFNNVRAGKKHTKSIRIGNCGPDGSELSWEISGNPDWGTWTFSPLYGAGIVAGDWITVNVEVVAPNKINSEFTGNIIIRNKNNSSDFCEIPIFLNTPRWNFLTNSFLTRLLDRFPNLFPILRLLMQR